MFEKYGIRVCVGWLATAWKRNTRCGRIANNNRSNYARFETEG